MTEPTERLRVLASGDRAAEAGDASAGGNVAAGAIAGTASHRGFVIRRLSVATDLAALLLVGVAAAALLLTAGRPLVRLDIWVFLAFVPVWPLIGIATRTYHPVAMGSGLSISISDEFASVFRVSTMWAWFYLLGRSIASVDPIQVIPSVLVWAMSIPAILLFRSLLRHFIRNQGFYRQDVIVVGRRSDTSKIVSRVTRHPEWGLRVVEEVDIGEGADRPSAGGSRFRTVGKADSTYLLNLAAQARVSRVIFATPPGQLDARTDLTRLFIETGVQVDFVPGEAEILRSGAVIANLEGLPLMSMPGARPPRSWDVLKRGMDLTIAVPTLLLVSPLLAYAAIRIRLDSPGGAFYRQVRAGRDGSRFEFLKLRTMYEGADRQLLDVAPLSLHQDSASEGVFKAVDDPRVTPVGRSLRRHSLDELPQLWNVVKGDMSLVGPRPLPIHEDERVAHHYELRRQVRPGLTGPWQVSGRSDIPFHDMLRLDYSYVLNWSLTGDIKLLVQTVDAVLRGRGAY